MESLRDVATGLGLTVADSIDLPSREPRFAPIPRALFDTRLGLSLHRQYPDGLWEHQAKGIDRALVGQNVVIATGTASGKSLIFRASVLHKLLLDPNARAIIFYPLKALAADQFRGWSDQLASLDLPLEWLGRIDGSVPMREREAILARARIVIMTPDIVQAWLMSRLAMPLFKEFLRDLKVMVLDEAHTLEGVFGSNAAFLMRRILNARHALQTELPVEPLQYIAATATIRDPAKHLSTLTGKDFYTVDDSDDGSPQNERELIHIVAPDGDEAKIARLLHGALVKQSRQFITFVDSRKGAEMLAASTQAELSKEIGADSVLPYRSGYAAEDRQQIEESLRNGTLGGVVSTSALELGIDLPGLSVGLNIGIPYTRKAFRQRLGRIGRHGDGAFALIAGADAFTGYGSSLRDYLGSSVEPSYLYLDNRFMQFAHARCLAEELESIGSRSKPRTQFGWPDGFLEVFEMTAPGVERPAEFDLVAQIGGDSPHYRYPLRSVGELNFAVAASENADPMGECSETQALRECYPGAIYFHMGRRYEVQSWHTSGLRPFVRVTKPHAGAGHSTTPRLRTWINGRLNGEGIVEGNALVGAGFFLAELRLHITEQVEGFKRNPSGEYFPYVELREKNPNMRRKSRNFRTTGVVLGIDEAWFDGPAREQLEVKLLNLVCREFSLSPQDVGSASTNVTILVGAGEEKRTRSVVLYDEAYGSLRLTERVFAEFDNLVSRLVTAQENATERDEVMSKVLHEIVQRRPSARTPGLEEITPESPEGLLQMFRPGSRVIYMQGGNIGTQVEILDIMMVDDIGAMYQVRIPGPRPLTKLVNTKYVQPSADSDSWEHGWWSPIECAFVDEAPEEA